jgi:hypothetical protein
MRRRRESQNAQAAKTANVTASANRTAGHGILEK